MLRIAAITICVGTETGNQPAFIPTASHLIPMTKPTKVDRRVPLSTAAYQAALANAGDMPLSDYVSGLLIQILKPFPIPGNQPASIPTTLTHDTASLSNQIAPTQLTANS